MRTNCTSPKCRSRYWTGLCTQTAQRLRLPHLLAALVLALALMVHASIPASAQAIATDWASGTSGDLSGTAVTLSNIQDTYIYPSDLSGADYAAAPLSTSTETVDYSVGSDWTATFSQPVSNLGLYVQYWRGVAAEVSPATYTFDQPFTILSGLNNATISGNTLILPNDTYHNGILQFAGPISNLSVDSNSPSPSKQLMTFAILPAANEQPVIAADNANVTVDEGQTATNTGTVGDADGDTVTLTASVGTVINNNDGTWSWSYPTGSTADSQIVTITADDGNGGSAQASFNLTVNAVAAINARINGTDCNLIDAITAANTDTATGACAAGTPGADTIELLDNVTLVNAIGFAGLPEVTSEITIEGAGFTIARDAGAPQFGILSIGSSGNLTVNQATISGGSQPGYGLGGGILNQGTLLLTNSSVTNNRAFTRGGIANYGTATLDNVTVSNNNSDNGIAGVGNDGGTMVITNSTIRDNVDAPTFAGGVYNSAGTLSIVNSTVSDNTGPGIYNTTGFGAPTTGVMTLTDSTITGNTASGVRNQYADLVTLERNLISGNGTSEIDNTGGTIPNGSSYNVVGYDGDARSVSFTPSSSDVVPAGPLSSILDTTLQNNGGDTETHALVTGSPAIDAAPSGPATDQRGVSRPQGSAFDIGAFEVEQASTEPGCAVIGWESDYFGQATPPAGLTDVVAIAAGGTHSLALKVDGTIVGWGGNSSGQLNIPAGLSDAVAISAGANHSLALKTDGTVVGWGDNSSGQLNIPAGLNDVVAISAGENHSLALKTDGTVVAWGSNSNGKAAPPTGLTDVKAIAAGYVHSLALKTDGTVVGWGYSSIATPPAGLSNVAAIAAGGFHNLALKTDGTVVAWGENLDNQILIPPGLNNVAAIAAGEYHSLSLNADGTVVGWGYHDTPPGLSDVSAIAAGGGHSLALIQNCDAPNTAPVAANDSYSTDEDTLVSVPSPGVLTNDSDGEGDPLTAHPVSSPANGSVTLNADGSFTYTPDANFNGTDSFTYVANDGMVNSNEATVTITVNAVNDAPTAMDDSYSADEDTPLNISAPGVLANDSDVEGDALSALLVSSPANGTLTLNPDGSFTYTPNADFNGSDSFGYKANDGVADSNVAMVNITVNAVNDAPMAANDSYSTDENTPLTVPAPGVLGNDSDVEGDALTAALVDAPLNGALTLNPDGSFTYTPDANFNGSDSFTYQANDGMADSTVAMVTIAVNAVNDAPIATADSYLTDEDVPLSVPAPGVLDNDTDVDGDALASVLVSGPANGSVTLNSDGSFSYTPNADYYGSDSFTYQANDGTADSNVATVTIVIGGINDAPLAADDSYNTDEDVVLSVPAPGVLGNDSDVDNDPLTVALVDAPLNGSVTLNTDGSFSYTPDTDFSGSDSFTYQLDDGEAASNVATVTITINPINDAPLAANDSYATNEDVPLSVPAPGVLDNDTDADGDVLTAGLVSGPAHGTLTLNPDGSFSYTPAANYNGGDSFTYQVNDGAADSNVATVSITVVAVNDPPIAGNDSYTSNEDTSLSVPAPGVLSNDSDPVEGSPVTAILVSAPSNGNVSLNPDGSFSYTPAPNYSGTDSFTYKANDGGADSNIATVSIEVISASSLIDTLSGKVQALVDSGALNSGQGNALIVKLDNAKKKLMKGQTNAAINMMQAFINQVNAFSGDPLTPAQAQELIDDANAIIVALN